MFKLRSDKVDAKHYANTLIEVNHQAEKWGMAFENYLTRSEEINNFLSDLLEKYKGKLRVIFTGAGTSEYVGNVIVDHLKRNEKFNFESIATTNIVSNPKLYLKNVPTLLVSFARSGNSPESMAALALADKLVENIHHMAITCSPEGKLAQELKDREDSIVLMMPEGTNDKGFAMTSSFTSMLLTALFVFDDLSIDEKRKRVDFVVDKANYVLSQEDRINDLGDFDFERIIYLGSGSLYSLTNECRLKILELTAGEVSAMFESSMGFRHGPKSYVNDKTFVVGLISNDEYTRKYDLDILREVAGDGIASKVLAISTDQLQEDFENFSIGSVEGIEDVYLALPYVVVAQLFSIIASVHVGNQTDTPSKTGTVNRVVKGVIIHEL